MTLTDVELVGFDDLKKVTPKPGDIVHIRRVGSWAGKRLSIDICEDLKSSQGLALQDRQD